ncbi:MAG: CRISPR-associated protein Cas4 [bacterium]
MFSEDDLLPISALQHLEFCERQWALIHLEQIWEENRLTAEGRVLHERVDSADYETRQGVRTARSLPLRSLRLGLTGRADVVEFNPVGQPSKAQAESGAVPNRLPAGQWTAYPIEFKRGRPKRDRCDEVQLCAQALCLEEMIGITVPSGALFYKQTRRRLEVWLTPDLRAHTEALAARLHELYNTRRTPPPEPGPKCRNCSLVQLCLPEAIGNPRRASNYLRRAVAALDIDTASSTSQSPDQEAAS